MDASCRAVPLHQTKITRSDSRCYRVQIVLLLHLDQHYWVGKLEVFTRLHKHVSVNTFSKSLRIPISLIPVLQPTQGALNLGVGAFAFMAERFIYEHLQVSMKIQQECGSQSVLPGSGTLLNLLWVEFWEVRKSSRISLTEATQRVTEVCWEVPGLMTQGGSAYTVA